MTVLVVVKVVMLFSGSQSQVSVDWVTSLSSTRSRWACISGPATITEDVITSLTRMGISLDACGHSVPSPRGGRLTEVRSWRADAVTDPSSNLLESGGPAVRRH